MPEILKDSCHCHWLCVSRALCPSRDVLELSACVRAPMLLLLVIKRKVDV